MNLHHDTATPTLSVKDPRALAIRSVGYWRHPDKTVIEPRITRQVFDAAGRLIQSWDPRLWGTAPKPNIATIHGLSGQPLLLDSVDAGWQLSLLDQAGSLRSFWDGRGSQRHIDYDDQQRPINVTDQTAGERPHVAERLTYGGSGPVFAAHNQCGQLVRHDDPAGSQRVGDYGLAGSVLMESRQFLSELETPDWPDELEARDELLEEQSFVTHYTFLPTGEIQRQIDAMENVRTFGYDVVGKLREVGLLLAGDGNQPQCLVSNIRYNADDQIESETAGKGVETQVEYDVENRRLTRLVAAVGNQKPLQDLNYLYDPIGNIVEVEDKSQAVTHFNNQRIEPISRYRYDSLYQLVEAKGWEVSNPSHGPALPQLLPTPLDPNQRRNYTQEFDYDPAGNLISRHHSGAPGFSMFTSAGSNRSLAQRDDGSLPGEPEITSGFDACGNQLELIRGQAMAWDVRNQLRRVTLVKREDEPDDYECYAYDRPGHRLRKVNFSQTGSRTLRTEVLYLLGLEVHRQADGEEHHVINVEAGRSSVRALHWPEDVHDDQLRYSLSDHLGSSGLELDDEAGVLTQEHYYSFGGTACWAGKSALAAKYKSFRYSGKERDATGLYYYGYRYYSPWLQRWISPDPAGDIDGVNLFMFVRNSSVSRGDLNGLDSTAVSSILMRRANNASDRADASRDFSRAEAVPIKKFKHLASVVMHRNEELKNLGGFVFHAKVVVPRDKSFFWSGDKVDVNGNVIKSAMLTAQFLAGEVGGSTIEMTSGGHKLDNYSESKWPASGANRSSPGFMFLKSRFKYMDSPSFRAELLTKLPERLGVDVERTLGASFFTRTENPLNSPHSGVAGVLWDVVSIRFARQATGDVNVIHAGASNDPYFQSPTFMRSTWLTKEKIAMGEEAKTTIIERFGEDLEDWQLQAPR
ncbi:RHS repeat domain-containing protein [Pseudomonas sp. RT4P38]